MDSVLSVFVSSVFLTSYALCNELFMWIQLLMRKRRSSMYLQVLVRVAVTGGLCVHFRVCTDVPTAVPELQAQVCGTSTMEADDLQVP
jgi:hypothetical protein